MERLALLKFNLATTAWRLHSVSTAEGALDSGKCRQWPIENETEKKTNLLPIPSLCPPLSSTLSIPSSPPVLCWREILVDQQAFPVCAGITVCDFSLTSQAALWHGGVIVSGGWKTFCYGRVEKDKAVPQPLCLAEHCGLVSPACWRTETGT